MLISRKTFVAALLITGFASCVLAADAKPLTGAEITAMLSGNTVKGPKFSEYYDPNGTVRGAESGSSYKGTWHVDSDKLCTDFPSFNFKDCITIRQKDATHYAFTSSKGTNTWSVVKGNPENF